MGNTYHGGPAFPVSPEIAMAIDPRPVMGMTLRDYFAAKALQGMLAYPGNAMWGTFAEMSSEEAARVAFGYADAMLAERAK